MPVYEFQCDKCGKKFEVVATLKEKEAGLKPTCPKCGGRDVHQIFGRIRVVTSRKTESEEGDSGSDTGGSEDLEGGSDSEDWE